MSYVKHKQTRRFGLHVILGMLTSFFYLCPEAQTYVSRLPNNIIPFQTITFPEYKRIQESRLSHQKWFVSRYVALSAGTVFYPGGDAMYFSAPIGLQLIRQLSNNLYAFGGLYAAPTFTSFNHSFVNSSFNKSYLGNLTNPYQIGINPGIQMGLMYVNDAGTFSISGSFRAESSSYPSYPAARNHTRK